MIHILDKKQCTGCQACGDACPKEAISFPMDEEGFWYPSVDASKCVDCGLCEKVCPLTHLEQIMAYGQKSPVVLGGYHENIAVRFDSTSGGAFSALAQAMYKMGGHVSGAIQNKDWSVTNVVSSSKRELAKLRSSKYVQSSAAGLYKEIKRLLDRGEKVLACGSPCQMGALRSFLGKDYENLIIVDFICRATNSPKAYAKYLQWLEKTHNSKIVSIKAKNKDHGWRSLARKVTFENGDVYYGEGHDDPYRRGYHSNFFERPSCHNCKFKVFPRCADITLGDFWGIENVDATLDHNLGTSCILLNTDKGRLFFEQAKCHLVVREFSLDNVLEGNREPLMTPVAMPQYDRMTFFHDMDTMSFDTLAQKYFPIKRPVSSSIKPGFFGRMRSRIGLLIRILRHPLEYHHLFKWSKWHKNIDADFRSGRVFDVQKYCSLDLHPTSRIIVEKGGFHFGRQRNHAGHKETALLLEENSVLRTKGNVSIMSGADIQLFKNSSLEIGEGTAINAGFQLVCAEKIVLGKDVHIGRDVWIRDNNGEHYIIQPGYTWKAPVVIGDHCWLCSNVSIMKGVTIGEGTVISAHSVVTHSLPAHCIAAGNPAEVVAENIIWRA
ncbi:MAG: putative acetyltransferase [Lentisphaerae bacterium ADurb.Bin082]|nr:MAG: putative acetyltransferase [Lentisphaerae bacterium ADurb.Bin082]